MKTSLHLAVAVLAILTVGANTGCGRKSSGETGRLSANSETAASDERMVLIALNHALRKYTTDNKKLPQSFAELVAAGYVKGAPAPPPGKKFEIDAKTASVVLQDH
jgi:hypothetical protein